MAIKAWKLRNYCVVFERNYCKDSSMHQNWMLSLKSVILTMCQKRRMEKF